MPGLNTGLARSGSLGGRPLLALSSAATALTTPLAGYGTIGVNDTGAVMHEAIGFKSLLFTLIGPGAILAGYTVTLYGTVDPALMAYIYGPPAHIGDGTEKTILPASSWFVLPEASMQSGAGVTGNPLISSPTGAVAIIPYPVVAVRAVLTATNTPTASATLIAMAVG